MKKFFVLVDNDDQTTSVNPFPNKKAAEKEMIRRLLNTVDEIDEEDEKKLREILNMDEEIGVIIGKNRNISSDNYGINQFGAWWDDTSCGHDWAICEIEVPENLMEDHSIAGVVPGEDFERLMQFDEHIRFLTENGDGIPYIAEYETPENLYTDWMEECNQCPANDALVVLPFDTLMRIIKYYKGDA